MTRRILAVLLGLGLLSGVARAQSQVQPRDWPDAENGSQDSSGTAQAAPAIDTGAATFAEGEGSLAASSALDRLWGRADFLLWWMHNGTVPPLLTAASPGGPLAPGSPGTSQLFGNSEYGQGVRAGGRYYIGYWFGPRKVYGVQIDAFNLSDRSTSYSAASNGSPILERPFNNPTTGMPDASVLAGPNSTATFSAAVKSTGAVGVNVLFRENLCCLSCPWMRVDWLGGYRFLYLSDRLDVSDQVTEIGAGNSAGLPGGSQLAGQDTFRTSTQFHGVDVGLTGESLFDRWMISWVTKIAIGTNWQVVDITGNTAVNQPGGLTQNYPGSFLTSPSNIGHYGRQTLAFTPEFDLRIGYRITSQLSAYLGYTFIYWSGVVRAPTVASTTVDTTSLAPSPADFSRTHQPFFFNGDEMWIQGLNFGLQYHF